MILGPEKHKDVSSLKRRSSSYFRKQKKRKAARAATAEQTILVGSEISEEDNHNKDLFDDATIAEDIIQNALEIVQIVNSEEESTFCKICDFISISKKGLNVHMRRKHGNIEQI